jgi:hypothetical protein
MADRLRRTGGDLRQRLARLEVQYACPRHHTPFICPFCDWPAPDEPLTLAEVIELDTLADRLYPNDLDDVSTGGPCRRCGGPMICNACLEAPAPAADRQLAATFAQLSPDERARVLRLLDKGSLLF